MAERFTHFYRRRVASFVPQKSSWPGLVVAVLLELNSAKSSANSHTKDMETNRHDMALIIILRR